jgi:hypothetical protein
VFHIDTLLVNSFTNSIGIFVLKVLDGKAKPPSSGRFQFNVCEYMTFLQRKNVAKPKPKAPHIFVVVGLIFFN